MFDDTSLQNVKWDLSDESPENRYRPRSFTTAGSPLYTNLANVQDTPLQNVKCHLQMSLGEPARPWQPEVRASMLT